MMDVTFALISYAHLRAFKKCTGIEIIKYDLDDQQAAKEVCDRQMSTDCAMCVVTKIKAATSFTF